MISRVQLVQEPKTLFVFGDNMLRRGFGGQAAEMRGEPNAVGIPTKNTPSNAPAAFFSDKDFETAKSVIDEACDQLETHLKNGGKVVWPEDGIGTGRADLANRSPKIWDYLEERRIQIEKIAVHNA